MQKEINIGAIKIGGKPFVFIGGPCVIESREITLKIAEKLKAILRKRLDIPFIFKASYDKANRTSVSSFRGLGIEEGLKIFSEVQEQFRVPILTDVHTEEEAAVAAEVVDIVAGPGAPVPADRSPPCLRQNGQNGKHQKRTISFPIRHETCHRESGIHRKHKRSSLPRGAPLSDTTPLSMISGHPDHEDLWLSRHI